MPKATFGTNDIFEAALETTDLLTEPEPGRGILHSDVQRLTAVHAMVFAALLRGDETIEMSLDDFSLIADVFLRRIADRF